MPIISEDKTAVIIVFSVEKENQQPLIDAAINNLEKVIKNKQGFISSSFHKSFDGTHVVNYAQWENKKSYDTAINFLTQDEVKIGEKIFELGEADWNVYDLVFSTKNRADILKNESKITMIELLSVQPNDQRDGIDKFKEFVLEHAQKQEGFISSNIHKSFDGKRIVNYSQWKNKESSQSLLANPDAQKKLNELRELGKIDWNLYQVVYAS